MRPVGTKDGASHGPVRAAHRSQDADPGRGPGRAGGAPVTTGGGAERARVAAGLYRSPQPRRSSRRGWTCPTTRERSTAAGRRRGQPLHVRQGRRGHSPASARRSPRSTPGCTAAPTTSAGPDSSDPATQANRFVDVAGGGIDGVTLPPALVLANMPGQPACHGLTPAQMNRVGAGLPRHGRGAHRGGGRDPAHRPRLLAGLHRRLHRLQRLSAVDRRPRRGPPDDVRGWRFHSFWQSSIGTLPGVTGLEAFASN